MVHWLESVWIKNPVRLAVSINLEAVVVALRGTLSMIQKPAFDVSSMRNGSNTACWYGYPTRAA